MGYQKPYHHTDEEFLDADIADLEVDIKCALEKGTPEFIEYAEKCKEKLEKLLKERAELSVEGASSYLKKADEELGSKRAQKDTTSFIDQIAHESAQQWLDEGLLDHYKETGKDPTDFTVTGPDMDHLTNCFLDVYHREPNDAELTEFEQMMHDYIWEAHEEFGSKRKRADSYNIPTKLPKYTPREYSDERDAIQFFIEEKANIAARVWFDQGLVDHYEETGTSPEDFIVTPEDIDYFSIEFEDTFERPPSEDELGAFEKALVEYISENA